MMDAAFLDTDGVKHLWGEIEGRLAGSGGCGPDGNPIGTIISYMGKTAPTGYLICDGTEYEIAQHSELARFFKEQFGSPNHFGGDGETTFAVPHLQSDSAVLYCIKAVESVPAGDVYSTEETRIGTWIDGKPLYRRVYVISKIEGNIGQDIPIQKIDPGFLVHDLRAVCYTMETNGDSWTFPFPHVLKTPGEYIDIMPNGTINAHFSIPSHMAGTIEMCIEYTKTTD